MAKAAFEFREIRAIVHGGPDTTVGVPFHRERGIFNVLSGEIVAPESSIQAHILTVLVIVFCKHDVRETEKFVGVVPVSLGWLQTASDS
jgi:hypothetical protein